MRTMKNYAHSDDGSISTNRTEECNISLSDAVPTVSQEGSTRVMIQQLQDSFTDNPNFYETTDGMNMLHKVCTEGLLQVMKCFVDDFHIDVNMTITTSRWKETPLHVACQHNQVAIAQYLLEKGGNIAAKQTNGYTPIHIACENGYFDLMVKLTESLVASGNRYVMELKQNDEWTGLQLAARNGHVKVFDYLLEKNLADATVVDSNGKTALHFACCNGNLDIVQVLVKHQQDYPNTDNANYITEAAQHNEWSALHLAARYGHADVVQCLITEGKVDANRKLNSTDHMTPLHLACQYGYVDVVQRLVAHHAIELDAVTKSKGLTAFHLACQHGHLQVLEELYEKNRELIDARAVDRTTSEHYASKFGHHHIVKWLYPLVKKTARIDEDGRTPLHFACIEGHIDIAKYLIMDTLLDQVKATDTHGKTALHYAIEYNRLALVECFSNLRDTFFEAEQSEESYLQYACRYGHVDIAKYLIQQQHVTVDHVKTDGWTALHVASRNNQLQIVELLLVIGMADVEKATKNEGWTALHLACRFGNLTVAKHLLHHGHAKVDILAAGEMTALHFAAANGHIDIAEILITFWGADIERKTADGLTPLHIASSRGSLGMTKLLLELGASVSTLNKSFETPLTYARRVLAGLCQPNYRNVGHGHHNYNVGHSHHNYTLYTTSISDIAALLDPTVQNLDSAARNETTLINN